MLDRPIAGNTLESNNSNIKFLANLKKTAAAESFRVFNEVYDEKFALNDINGFIVEDKTIL